MEDWREWISLSLLYANDWAICGESEEDLRPMVGRFAEVCRRRGLKFNAGKSKVMVLNGEEGMVDALTKMNVKNRESSRYGVSGISPGV